MKACIYYAPKDIRVEEIARPDAGDNGIVIKVGACGICPIMDVPRFQRELLDHARGIAFGHEFCGDVVEIGSRVDTVRIGDRVYGLAFQPCGKCSLCLNKDFVRCINFESGMAGTWINGGFAEYLKFPFVTPENIMTIPDSMSHRDGALIEPVSVAVGLASKAKEGDVVVIIGQELMGLATVAELKARGIKRIIVSDISDKRLEKSADVGADIIVHEHREDLARIVIDETHGFGADVVIETAGRAEAFINAVDVVRPHGSIWLGAFYESPFMFDPSYQRPERPHSNLTQKGGMSIHCAWLTLPDRTMRRKRAMEIIQKGEITAEKHVTHFFSMDRITEAFEVAMNPQKSIKVIVEP